MLANRCCPPTPPHRSPSSWNTLWEVISLPVLALPGQPSGAATSLCPSVPRLHGLPASSRERGGGRERRKGLVGGGVSCESPQDTHDAHTEEVGGCTKACALQYKQRYLFYFIFFLQKLQHLSHSLLPRRAPFLVSLRAWAQVNGVTAKAAEIGHYYALGTDCSWRTFSAATGSSGAAMTYTNNCLERKICLRMKRRWKY